MTRDNLIIKLRPFINNWYWIDNSFNLWESYGFEELSDNVIKITLAKNRGDEGRFHSQSRHRKVFRNIIKELRAELIEIPRTDELWYNDSLEWLYKHYRFGVNNGSNAVLINWQQQIIAVQYNWLKNTSYIRSLDCYNIPDYIVINETETLEGVYYKEDYKTLEPKLKGLSLLFNNNNNERL